ncbi:unnamed protein product [Durusdinium trenchii]|uniref:Uncharacterized protein n=2 Tax=Durusdinium trenchii TaxID=1381693 RepID=A0ABP0S096_9DINO
MALASSVTMTSISFQEEVKRLNSKRSRSVREQLPTLLRRLHPEQRRAVIARLSQGQRMQLERWVLAQQIQKQSDAKARYAKAKIEPIWGTKRGSALRKRCGNVEDSTGHGIYHRRIAGRSTYEATASAGPFSLSTRWTSNFNLAMQHKQILQSIRDRMERSKAEIQVSFKEAIAAELQNHGHTAKELNLTFVTRVGARYWVGRSLETPRFLAEGLSLERGLRAWERLRKARCTVFEGACNELSLLSQHSPGELAEAWTQLRSVYLDIWEESGHLRSRVLRRLERLERRQEPRRMLAEQRWRAACRSHRKTGKALPGPSMVRSCPLRSGACCSGGEEGLRHSHSGIRTQEILLRHCERLLARWANSLRARSGALAKKPMEDTGVFGTGVIQNSSSRSSALHSRAV